MGKINSAISFTGRVGNLVGGKGPKGQTVIRNYQPTVANPRTAAQLEQRAKVNLAGQFSRITPAGALTALGAGSKANNRNALMANLLKAATVRYDGGSVAADVALDAISFGHGDTPLMATATAPVVAAGSVTLNLTLTNNQYANVYGERIVVVIVKKGLDAKFERVLHEDVILAGTQSQAVTINFPVALENGHVVAVYRVPFLLSLEGQNKLATDPMFGDPTNQVITALIARYMGAVRAWGESEFVSSQLFPQG